MKKRITLPDGQFMGEIISRSQLRYIDRSFVIIDVGRQTAGYNPPPTREARSKPPHPEHSAYQHTWPDRPVPLIMLEAPPAFYLADDVSEAMANAIDAVCSCGHPRNLMASRVHALRLAGYPLYDTFRADDYEPWDSASSLFERDVLTLPLDAEGDPWHLDLRFSPGVYRAEGYAWLGIFMHGIARMALPGWDQLTPDVTMEKDFHLRHRGQDEPMSLFFDLLVPVEPEIVTKEWGWGEELETVTEALAANSGRDARLDSVPDRDPFCGGHLPSWQQNSRRATKVAVAVAVAQIDHEAMYLRAKYSKENDERRRASRILHRHAWQALMLAVIECRQLTVERREL